MPAGEGYSKTLASLTTYFAEFLDAVDKTDETVTYMKITIL